jgi:tetratricopeptide (TPR) repeat protein
VKDNTLSVERVFTIKSAKLSVAQWEEYCKFAKSVEGDVQRMIQLVHTDSGATSRVVRDDPQAAEFVQKAAQALQSRNFNVARDALAQAERINPEQSGLWMTRAFVYALQSQNEKAVDALKKEIEYHPGNTPTYQFLGALQVQLGHRDEAIAALRQWVKVAPEDPDAVHALASSLIEVKKYDEAAVPLRAALKADPDNLRLNVTLADVLVRGGHKPEAIALVEKLREKPLDAHMLNQIAWSLADTNTEPALARDLSAKAIADYENQLKDVTLQSLSREHLDLVDPLGATWDTLGWAWFELGELDKAERYLNAAWVLLQNPSVADHLGQLRERQGRKADAIRAYKLALAVKSDLPDTRERLVKLGGAAEERPSLRRGVQSAPKISPEEEVSEIRTTRLPDLKAKPGSAEFFLLFSAKGVEDVQFLRGDEHLKSAAGALRSAHHNAPFPDAGPAKIARRGILSCSAVTAPACSLVLLLPVNTTLN